MATLVNKLNREVNVIIPNMREFSTFYSDNEGVLPMFFKKDWKPVKEEHWKPSEEQMEVLERFVDYLHESGNEDYEIMDSFLEQIQKL